MSARTRLLSCSTVLASMLTGALLPYAAPAVSSSSADPASAKAAAWTALKLPNASFNDGRAHWRVREGTDLRTTRVGHQDAAAVVLRSKSRPTASLLPADQLESRTVAGRHYQASVWFKTSTGKTPVRVRLTQAASGKSRMVASRRAVATENRGWFRVTVEYDATSSGAALDLEVVASGLTPGQQVIVDDVTVRWRVPTAPTADPASRSWKSGASGQWVANNQFADWRGSAVDIAGTWNDNVESHEEQWSLQPGAEYGDWQGDLDVAVGGIYQDRGESWSAAASGAYDARWRRVVANIATYRAGKPGTTYVRFAHEFNGTWFPWSVTGNQVGDFKKAWVRFAQILEEKMPQAQLVFCPTYETTDSLDLDWRTAYPGSQYVDVLAVDVYNQWPFVETAAEFASMMTMTDRWGAPRGLEEHRRFAAGKGRPFALAEWSSNADFGDSPVFMSELHAWLTEHGGTGAGELLYEIQFDVGDFGTGQYQLFPTTRQSQASATYQSLW